MTDADVYDRKLANRERVGFGCARDVLLIIYRGIGTVGSWAFMVSDHERDPSGPQNGDQIQQISSIVHEMGDYLAGIASKIDNMTETHSTRNGPLSDYINFGSRFMTMQATSCRRFEQACPHSSQTCDDDTPLKLHETLIEEVVKLEHQLSKEFAESTASTTFNAP